VPPAYRDAEIPPPPPLGSDHQTLARWLMDHPCNRPGTDKTWAARLSASMARMYQTARLLPGVGPEAGAPR
jgi:hypothetical protein